MPSTIAARGGVGRRRASHVRHPDHHIGPDGARSDARCCGRRACLLSDPPSPRPRPADGRGQLEQGVPTPEFRVWLPADLAAATVRSWAMGSGAGALFVASSAIALVVTLMVVSQTLGAAVANAMRRIRGPARLHMASATARCGTSSSKQGLYVCLAALVLTAVAIGAGAVWVLHRRGVATELPLWPLAAAVAMVLTLAVVGSNLVALRRLRQCRSGILVEVDRCNTTRACKRCAAPKSHELWQGRGAVQILHADLGLALPGALYVAGRGRVVAAANRTLLAVLAGLTAPDAGRVTALGQDIWSLRPALRAMRFGCTIWASSSRARSCFPRCAPSEQIELVLGHMGLPPDVARDRAMTALEDVGLGACAMLRPDALSGGEISSGVAIACVAGKGAADHLCG